MRNLKRALSLVMAMALIVGMMVVSASAVSKDFTDAGEIDHTEAVDVLVTLNVISGKEDGSYFDPAGTLTRAEMAKIVAYVMNGGVEPNIGTKVIPTYSDIDNTWAEKYIEYCTSMGIIAGDGQGKFNPTGTLTASQAAKMLLTAMNYKDDIFGFLGNAWEINVNREANAAGLYDELGGIRASDPISRDDAAQMVYNAIQSKTMELTWSRDMQTGEITQTYQLEGPSLFAQKFNGTIYEGVLLASGSVAPYDFGGGKEKVTVDAKFVNGDEKSLPNHTTLNYAVDCTDMLGEYVKVLYNTKDKIVYGVYTIKDETTVVINTTVGALSDVGTPANTLTYDGTTYDVDTGAKAYFIDKDANVITGISAMALGTDTRLANYDNVKLVDNDGDEKIDVAIVIENQVEQVTYVGSDRITLTGKGELKAADANYSDLAVDDYVSYTSAAANYDGKINVTKAAVVSGEVTEVGKNSDSPALVNKVQIAGTWYTLGEQNGAVNDPIKDTDNNELAYKVSYDLYLVNGYAAVAEKLKGNNIKVAVVTGVTGTRDYDRNQQARLLLADGTTVEGFVDYATILDEGDFIAYTMDGTIYKAVKVGNAIPGTPPDETPLAGYDNYDQGLSKGDAAFNATTKELDGDAGDKKVNKDAVVFVQYDGDGVTGNYGKKFMVTTGAELNAWKSNWGNNVYFLSNDTGLTYADIVYIQGAQDDILPGIKNNYGYITSAVTEGQDSEGVYSSFTIWDGSDSYNVIARKSISNLGATKGSAIKFEWDGENVVKDVTPVANTGAVVYSNGTQVRLADNLTSNGYDLADDVVIINVSTKDKAGVAGNAITTAAQTSNSGVYHYNCWYVYDSTNKEIDVLIIDVTSNKLDGVATLTVDLEP